jgi:uncharacterized membrane protein YeaQ/YmgE (transglycosylase-associated protein family)
MSRWLYTGLIGLVTGWIARFMLPGSDDMGLIRTTIFGLAGSYVGTYIAQKGGVPGASTTGNSIIWSVIGAMLLLFLNRLI